MVKQFYVCNRKKSEIEVGSSPRGTTTKMMSRHNIYRVVSLLPCSTGGGAGGGGGGEEQWCVVCVRTGPFLASMLIKKEEEKKKIQSYYDNIKTLSMTTEIMHS